MGGNKAKAGFAVVALCALVPVGLYLAGWLVRTLLHVDVEVGLGTWLQYWRALDLPQMAPYARTIRIAGAVGLGLPVLAWLLLLIPLLRTRAPAMHGDARFASGADLARHKMLDPAPNGIVVGKYKRKLVRLPGQQFVVLAAPTRSGKGVGIVIPNLLDYGDSVVVLDIKGENYELTSGWRQSQGHEVYVFNPFDRATHRWNPLHYISSDPAFRISDIQAMAASLYPDGSDDQKFWVSQARNAFTAAALYLFDRSARHAEWRTPKTLRQVPTLGSVYRLFAGDGSDLKAYLRELSKEDFLTDEARTAFAGLLSQEKETFSSIIGTVMEPLNMFISPIMSAATGGDDFNLNDVRRKQTTIYICVPPNKLAESRKIVNLYFSQLINLNTRELPQNNPELKHQCLLLMDEFTSIGKVEILASAISYMAGYNLRSLPIIQSMSQLDAVYGREVARTLLTNHALQIIYAPREQQDANDYSEMLGYTTVRKRNVTRGRETSHSETEERRALMLPQELKAMGFDAEIFLYEGIPHPVKCDKIKYYQDKYFTQRLLPKVALPMLALPGDNTHPQGMA